MAKSIAPPQAFITEGFQSICEVSPSPELTPSIQAPLPMDRPWLLPGDPSPFQCTNCAPALVMASLTAGGRSTAPILIEGSTAFIALAYSTMALPYAAG